MWDFWNEFIITAEMVPLENLTAEFAMKNTCMQSLQQLSCFAIVWLFKNPFESVFFSFFKALKS